MGDGNGKAREIDLGDDFGAVVVNVNGAQVTIGADGSLHGIPASANDPGAKVRIAPEIGEEMPDGTILAGYYEGKALYATPRDAPGRYTFNQAARYAKCLDAHGHQDFRVPREGELDVLWENRNEGKLKGTFNETGSFFAGWYWSSSSYDYLLALAQRFSDGGQVDEFRGLTSSLRCVR